MAAPAHVRLTYSGLLGDPVAGPEAWSLGISLSPGDLAAAGDATIRTALQAFVDAVDSEFMIQFSAKLSPVVLQTRTRAAYIKGDGLTRRSADGAYLQADSDYSYRAGGQNSFNPWQMSLAVTLESAFAGPTGRGRFFLPVPADGVGSTDGRFSDEVRDVIRADAVDLVNALNTAADAAWNGQVVVASGGSVKRGLSPALHPVVKVGVGRRPDVIRSRAANLDDSRESVPI